MRKFFASATAVLLAALGIVTQAASSIPLDYYSSLNGKKGSELKTAIHNLLTTNVKMLGYGSGNQNTWWGFYVTDYEMDGSQRLVVDRYSNNVWYFGSRGASVSGMNIEHSFPKSWWGGTQNNAYKDLFNLMPCEKNINTSKSNYGMGVVTNVKTDNGCTKVGTGADGTNLWEPADKWKGDFARGYMYMATAYQDFTWTSEGLNSLQQGAYPTLQKWASDLYIKWAKADPVDDREITRKADLVKRGDERIGIHLSLRPLDFLAPGSRDLRVLGILDVHVANPRCEDADGADGIALPVEDHVRRIEVNVDARQVRQHLGEVVGRLLSCLERQSDADVRAEVAHVFEPVRKLREADRVSMVDVTRMKHHVRSLPLGRQLHDLCDNRLVLLPVLVGDESARPAN